MDLVRLDISFRCSISVYLFLTSSILIFRYSSTPLTSTLYRYFGIHTI